MIIAEWFAGVDASHLEPIRVEPGLYRTSLAEARTTGHRSSALSRIP
jgi:hypothetical protein